MVTVSGGGCKRDKSEKWGGKENLWRSSYEKRERRGAVRGDGGTGAREKAGGKEHLIAKKVFAERQKKGE